MAVALLFKTVPFVICQELGQILKEGGPIQAFILNKSTFLIANDSSGIDQVIVFEPMLVLPVYIGQVFLAI